MSERKIVMRKTSPKLAALTWLALFLVMALTTFLVQPVIRPLVSREWRAPIMIGICLILLGVVAKLLNVLVLPGLRQGAKLMRQERFQEAMDCFTRAFDFYSRHPGIDGLRWLIRLDPSEWSYREISLLNIAACYFRMGDAVNTKATYERVLAEYPENEIAQNAVKAMAMYQEMGVRKGQAEAEETQP